MDTDFTETRHLSKKDALSNTSKKLVGWFILFVGGLGFTITGIGAIIGIPCMLYALFVPFINYYEVSHSLEGNCPNCGHTMNVNEKKPGANCRACKKRVVLKGAKFYLA